MGQLEKYGLYVLCLVIFLILGVTIWGGDEVQPARTAPPVAPIRAAAAPESPRAVANMAEDILGILDQAPPSPRPDRPAAEAASGAGSGAGAVAVVDSVLGAPTPAPAATPAVYKVQKGDTLASIAKAKLGKESLWTEIQRLNPAVKASTLKPDQVLKLPTAPAASPAKPALDEPLAMPADGAREYVVRKGDTFERIAVAQLGSRKRTDEIRALNPNTPPEKLRTGMTLKLPKK